MTKYNKEATNEKYKSSEEILDGMIIHEMLSESECSDDESIQASIITSLTNKFDIIEEEFYGNCLLGNYAEEALDLLIIILI